MPIPVFIIGALGIVSVVGVMVNHSNHSDHTNYSDAEVKRKKNLTQAKKNLCEASNAKNEAILNAIAALEGEFTQKGMEMPLSMKNLLTASPSEQVDEGYSKIESELRTLVCTSIDAHLEAQIVEKAQELDRVNMLLQRIQSVQLMGRPMEQLCQNTDAFYLALHGMDKVLNATPLEEGEDAPLPQQPKDAQV